MIKITFPPAGVLTGSTAVVLISCVTAVCTEKKKKNKILPAQQTRKEIVSRF